MDKRNLFKEMKSCIASDGTLEEKFESATGGADINAKTLDKFLNVASNTCCISPNRINAARGLLEEYKFLKIFVSCYIYGPSFKTRDDMNLMQNNAKEQCEKLKKDVSDEIGMLKNENGDTADTKDNLQITEAIGLLENLKASMEELMKDIES